MTKKGFCLLGTFLCGLIGLPGLVFGIYLMDESEFGFILLSFGVIFSIGALICFFFYQDEKQLERLYSKEALNAKHEKETKDIGRFWKYFFILFPILFAIFWFLFPILFGTADDRDTCRMDGCTLPAASSGDSVYCVQHSNRCVYCGCYIDADALVCMDCVEDALQD